MSVYLETASGTWELESRLRWDGSCLGFLKPEQVVAQISAYPLTLWKLSLESPIWVAAHASTSVYPCVVDELAPLFGLRKVGTHSVKWQGRRYIIYNTGRHPVTLKEYKVPTWDYKFCHRVQDVFAFRVLMGLRHNYETDILVVDHAPHSYNNRFDINAETIHTLPDSVVETWFTTSLATAFRRLAPRDLVSQTKLRDQVQKVIKRLDPELIWLDSQIWDTLFRVV